MLSCSQVMGSALEARVAVLMVGAATLAMFSQGEFQERETLFCDFVYSFLCRDLSTCLDTAHAVLTQTNP